MNAKVRALVGVLTTVVFLSIGAMLLAEGNNKVAALLLALGAFRGAIAARQVVGLFAKEENPPV